MYVSVLFIQTYTYIVHICMYMCICMCAHVYTEVIKVESRHKGRKFREEESGRTSLI